MTQPIFFPIETKNREFDGKLLLSSHLLKRFDRIYIGSRKSMKREALAQKNGIYFLKSLAKEETPFYEKLRNKGYTLALIHAEGGIHYKDNKQSILSAFNGQTLQLIDRNYVFGEKVKLSVENLTGFTYNVVSGDPRFDLLKSKYKEYFSDELKSIKEGYKSYILINTNFGLANSFVGTEQLNAYYENEKTLTEQAKKLLLYKLKYQKSIINNYFNAIRYIADRHPKINFIVRPHPSESEVEYRKIENETNNVFVEKNGNVVPWILGAEIVIHYDCTTGMEAALAGIPVISYLPERDDDILAWLPVELSQVVTSQESLSELISEILQGNNKFEIPENTLNIWRSFIANVDIESSATIVNDLESLIDSTENIKNRKDNRFNLTLYYERIRSNLKSIKDNRIGKSSITRGKFGIITKREIEKKLMVLRNINGFDYDFSVSKISHDTFLITKK